jgi:hypothetical protein
MIIRSKNWRGTKLIKDATKKLFSDGIKTNMRNAETGALKSREITLKSK